jgi:hypothetical protein
MSVRIGERHSSSQDCSCGPLQGSSLQKRVVQENVKVKILVSAIPHVPEQCPFIHEALNNRERWYYCSILSGKCTLFVDYFSYKDCNKIYTCACLEEVSNAGE